MIVNPVKLGKDARKVFTFNKVYGTTVTQRKSFDFRIGFAYCIIELRDLKIKVENWCSFDFAEHIYADTQAFVRSVMDGFNVCIFAYGQTGSGKTYTMVCCRMRYAFSKIFIRLFIEEYIYMVTIK